MTDIAWIFEGSVSAYRPYMTVLEEAGINSACFFNARTFLDDGRTFPLLITPLFVAPGTLKGDALLECAWQGSGGLESYARIAEHLVKRARERSSVPIVTVGLYSSDSAWSTHIKKLLTTGADEYINLGFGSTVTFPEFADKILDYLQK